MASRGLDWADSFFFFQAEDGIRDNLVTGVQTCALPIYAAQLQPGSRRHAVPAGVCILLIILPGRFSLLRLQMELAQLNGGLVVRWQIVLAPMELRSEERRVGKECRSRRSPYR